MWPSLVCMVWPPSNHPVWADFLFGKREFPPFGAEPLATFGIKLCSFFSFWLQASHLQIRRMPGESCVRQISRGSTRRLGMVKIHTVSRQADRQVADHHNISQRLEIMEHWPQNVATAMADRQGTERIQPSWRSCVFLLWRVSEALWSPSKYRFQHLFPQFSG